VPGGRFSCAYYWRGWLATESPTTRIEPLPLPVLPLLVVVVVAAVDLPQSLSSINAFIYSFSTCRLTASLCSVAAATFAAHTPP